MASPISGSERAARQAADLYDIYSNARDDAWRYTLGRSGRRPLYAIGLNPSTATREKSDTTVAKVERVARRHGYDGFVMLNLYPVRATDFNELARRADARAFSENVERIEAAILADARPVVWAAWGQSILARSFFVDAVVELLSRLGEPRVSWRHFGKLTAAGHPRHPSRLNDAWAFSPLDVERYARVLAHAKVKGAP